MSSAFIRGAFNYYDGARSSGENPSRFPPLWRFREADESPVRFSRERDGSRRPGRNVRASERLSEIRHSRREPSDKAERFQRALRYRNLLDGRPGRPIHSGNLCFVSPADRTAGEFDLTTTCPETPRIRVHVSRCALPIYRVRLNFGNILCETRFLGRHYQGGLAKVGG